jgi:hypothetical protein
VKKKLSFRVLAELSEWLRPLTPWKHEAFVRRCEATAEQWRNKIRSLRLSDKKHLRVEAQTRTRAKSVGSAHWVEQLTCRILVSDVAFERIRKQGLKGVE